MFLVWALSIKSLHVGAFREIERKHDVIPDIGRLDLIINPEMNDAFRHFIRIAIDLVNDDAGFENPDIVSKPLTEIGHIFRPARVKEMFRDDAAVFEAHQPLTPVRIQIDQQALTDILLVPHHGNIT
jgi:hypothetical protein